MIEGDTERERVTGTETDNNKLGAQKSRLKKDRREAAKEKRAESGGGEAEAARKGGGGGEQGEGVRQRADEIYEEQVGKG